MEQIILFGAGGHCHAVIDVIESTGLYEIKGVIDPECSQGVLGYPVLGTDRYIDELVSSSDKAHIAVGQIRTPVLRERIYNLLMSRNIELPTIVSPFAYVSPRSMIQRSCTIMHAAVVNARATLGCNNIINSSSLIEHDVTIGDHCHISTGALLNGGVSVGDGTFIGSGAIIREGVQIGNRVVVSAGAVVMSNVPDGQVVRR